MAYHGGPGDGGPGPDDSAFSARVPCCRWRCPGGGEGWRQEGEAKEGGGKEVEVEAAAAVVGGETWRRPGRTWRPHARHLLPARARARGGGGADSRGERRDGEAVARSGWGSQLQLAGLLPSWLWGRGILAGWPACSPRKERTNGDKLRGDWLEAHSCEQNEDCTL
jgi:hypothetical protein